VLAVLTLICMVTFVMASGMSGGGDVFSEIQRLVRGRGQSDTATLYGRRIDPRELMALQHQRKVINEFMMNAVRVAANESFQDVIGPKSTFDEDTRGRVRGIIQNILNSMMVGGGNRDLYLDQLTVLEGQLEKERKTAEAQKIRQVRAAIQQQAWIFRFPKDELYPTANLYFGGSLSLDGLVDFMIWRHEADRLGIELSDADIGRALKQEALNQLSNAGAIEIAIRAGVNRRDPLPELFAGLRDEYRVRLAQIALVGYDAGGTEGGTDRVPAPITPYELWQYYLKNRAEVDVKLLPIPVQNFLAKVTGEPSEGELRELYEKYKDDEYAPQKPTPGFKQGRRVQVEWVEANPESEIYRKATDIAAKTSQLIAPLAWDSKIWKEYEDLKYFQYQSAVLTEPDFALSFYTYAAQKRPENAAATLGILIGSASTAGTPFSAVAGNEAAAIARESKDLAGAVEREAQDRARGMLPLTAALFAAVASPAPSLSVGGIWVSGRDIKRYLPLEVVKKEISENIERSLASQLVKSSLDAFKKELEGKRGQKNAEIEKYVKTEVERHGWKHGAMTKPLDRYGIIDDSALEPLKKQYLSTYATGDPKGKNFAEFFFRDAGPDPSKLYTPQDLRLTLDQKQFVYWKTVDEPAKTVSFEEAKPLVLTAWRLEKARALAKGAADKVAEQARKSGGDPIPNLTEASKSLGVKLFDLEGVARLKPAPSFRAGFGDQYAPYKVPEDKIEYAPEDLADELLKLKEKGDVNVLTDQPERNYYVVALTQRSEPTVRDFQMKTSTNYFQYRGFVLSQLEQERRKEYRLAVLDQLRTQAKRWINEERRGPFDERRGVTEE